MAIKVPVEVLDSVIRQMDEPKELFKSNGPLQDLFRQMVERISELELTEHVGYEKHDTAGRNSGNSRNGRMPAKTVHTSLGDVEVEMARDRAGTFEPEIIPAGATDVGDLGERVIALYGSGLTTRDIQKHLIDIYGVDVSPDWVSGITDGVLDEMRAWRNRPLDPCYPIIYIDALFAKVREQGMVSPHAAYLAVGVSLEGRKVPLGLWVTRTEGAKFWLKVLTDLRNRGVTDVCIVRADGLKGIPDVVETVWPEAILQSCTVHLIRNSLRYASWKDRKRIAADLKPIYRAANEDDAAEALEDFATTWAGRYPAIVDMWRHNWEHFTPFFMFPPEIRRIIYTTNSIESINRRLRKIIKTRGHFPHEDALMKVLYLGLREIDRKGGLVTQNWQAALNQFAILFPDTLDKYMGTS